MRRLQIPFAFAFAAACAAPAPRYAAHDPLSGAPSPSAHEADGVHLYTAVIPQGYTRSDGRFSAPLVEFLHRPVYGGEASIMLERYREADGAPDRESFARNLHPSRPVPTLREFAQKKLAVYHDLRFESYTRRISTSDPYADVRGEDIAPPRLDPLGKRRFPKGGDAFRLHRCKKKGAWAILTDQTRARVGLEKGSPEPKPISPRDRSLLATCFGRGVLEHLEKGEPYGSIPKPSLSRLRLMATDEWEHGAARRIERECVHLRPTQDGYAVIRFRAPDHAFDDQHAAFELFLGSLTVPGETTGR